MAIPTLNLAPPFNVTRASHVVLTVRDLGAAKAFYVDAVGLTVSEETKDALYLRGMEEISHHCVVLKRSGGPPVCERVGLRVFTEDDLDKAKRWFDGKGLPAEWVEVAHQGRTLRVRDNIGTPLEFCATMEVVPRLLHAYDRYRGGAAQRLDHFQLYSPDVDRSCDYYVEMGFRASEYTADEADQLWMVFLQRKGNPHDLVFTNGAGPRLHHVAFTLREAHDLIHACDTAGALGFGRRLERGPGRHGMGGGALFVYFRDPDGHRVELFHTHYQMIDLDAGPQRWELGDAGRANIWGPPAVAKWFSQATAFADTETREPRLASRPQTLEEYLAQDA